MTATPVLNTARLRLRARVVADAEALLPIMSDAELMTWWSHAPIATLAEAREHLQIHIDQPGWRCWAITRGGGDDRAIGFVAAGEERQGGVSELGYILGRADWGQGIAHEATSAVIDQLFAEGQRRVYADTDPENVESIALLERLGFRREGLLRGEWETHIGVRDAAIFGLLATEWRAFDTVSSLASIRA